MTRIYLAAGIGKPEHVHTIFQRLSTRTFSGGKKRFGVAEKLGIPADDFVIGKIARLFKLKGHDDLFAAFQQLLPQCPNDRLLLVGDGALASAFGKSCARNESGGQNHCFTGLVPPDEVPRYVGIMDCLAHLSSREALARALPQALAAGKPVVAYDFDGARRNLPGRPNWFFGSHWRCGDRCEKIVATGQRCRAPRKHLGRRGQILSVKIFPSKKWWMTNIIFI